MMNTLKTTVLLAGMTALFMGVGYMLGGNSGMVIAFLFALGTNVFAYWNSDKMVLSMQNAHPIDEHSMPEYVEMVAQLAANANIPMPRLYIIETDQPNAFATGRNPANGVVAVSSGLLRYMNNEEVAAVVAHEIAHIKNHDTLTMTITATLAGAISMLAQWGMFFGGGNRENNNGGGIIGAIAMMILAPIAASLVQMAVSRTREYEADKDGAMICGQPLALASALQKIQAISQQVHNPAAERNPAMAHMYISNPLSGARMDNLFSTHPDTENRVNALVAMANSMGEPISSGYRPRQSASSVRNNKQQSSTLSWRAPSTVEKPNDDNNNRGPWGNL